MERSAAVINQDRSITDGSFTTYKVSQRSVWVENDSQNFVSASDYEHLLKADIQTQEEIDKIEMKAKLMISKDLLASKFATEGIFYDVTKQAHYKLLKKAPVKGGVDSDEWEAEKMQKTTKNKVNQKNYQNVKECNLREYIYIMIQSVVENSAEVANNLIRVRASESIG